MGSVMRSAPSDRRVALMTALLAALAAAAAAVETEQAAVHLVGHEDMALLARIQDVIDDWDPRRLENPYLGGIPEKQPDGSERLRLVVKRPDLLEFVADAEAAVALGKALFWDMQAGSDFGRRVVDGEVVYQGTACASCHYRSGADPRDRHTSRVAYVAWDRYRLDPGHPAAADPANPREHLGEFVQRPFIPNGDVRTDVRDVSLVVGSQGVEPRVFDGLNVAAPPGRREWRSELSNPRTPSCEACGPAGLAAARATTLPEWMMFLEGQRPEGRLVRQITGRNSPTIVNSVFADRLFHDGRAESTFNGFSIFGDHDPRTVLHRRDGAGRVVPVRVAISHAALASQSVGPIVNDVEMSYLGRTFPDVADKLLDRPWLEHQEVSPTDSVLSRKAWFRPDGRRVTYRQLIKKAFRSDWWAESPTGASHADVPLVLDGDCATEQAPMGTLVEANFPLFWGLSLMLYQSTLISNASPFDAMLRGDGGPVEKRWQDDYRRLLAPVMMDRATTAGGAPPPELSTGTAVFQLGFRTFIAHGCVECHEGPLFSAIAERDGAVEPGPPIAKTIGNTLLPFAQADAIAINVHRFRLATIAEVARLLGAAGIPPAVGESLQGALWDQLTRAHGDIAVLRCGVRDVLGRQPVAVSHAAADAIADLLMTYEKRAATSTGGRIAFSEDERVALAEELTTPVLVEKMLIPTEQRPLGAAGPLPFLRPRLPIAGALAGEAYAFYDSGFYALGVSPPRLDRGIGGWEAMRSCPPGRPLAAARGTVAADAATEEELVERQQAANGARGTAYRFPMTAADAAPAMAAAAACNPGPVPEFPFDISWSRSVFPPVSGIDDLAVRTRRSDAHFLARSRRLVFNEEPYGYRKPFLHDNELAFWGAFRTPTLRNVEITAPYMHNGRLLDIDSVIEFYDDGGTLWQRVDTNPDKHPAMVPLGLTESERKALRFFLACLTDPRVRFERAPFDHPSLVVVNGYEAATGRTGRERLEHIPATGASGLETPLPLFPAVQ
jgi:cytochrome c peroxidase